MPGFAWADTVIAFVSFPILLLLGNQSYLLGLTLVEFGKQVALLKYNVNFPTFL